MKDKIQLAPNEFNPEDWDSDVSEALIAEEAEEDDSEDDSNLSSSEIERQQDRIRTMRGDLFVRAPGRAHRQFLSLQSSSRTERAREVPRNGLWLGFRRFCCEGA